MYPMEALEETLRATAAQQWQHAIFIFDCFENCERDFGKRLLALLTEVRCTTVGTIGLLVAGSASLYEMSVSEASPFLVADMIRLPAFGLKLVRDTLATWFANRGLVSEDEGLRAILEATGGDDVLVTMLANDLGKGVRHERITKESVLQSLDRLWGDGELREERIALVRQLISRSPRLWEDLQEILLTGHRQALVDGVDIDRLAEVPGLRCDKGKYSAAGTLNWSMLAEALQSCDPRRVARQSTNISGYTTGRRGDYMEVRLHEPDGTRPRLLVPYELFVEAGMIVLLRTVVRDGRIVTYVDADHSQAQHIEIPPDVSAALERLEADEYGSTEADEYGST